MVIIVLVLALLATTASAELYTWKDGRGVSHYTNQPDTIPLKYRSRARKIPMPGDQKDQAVPLTPQVQPQQPSQPAVSVPPPSQPQTIAVPPPVREEPPASQQRKRRRNLKSEE